MAYIKAAHNNVTKLTEMRKESKEKEKYWLHDLHSL